MLAGDWPSTGGVLNITAATWTAGFQWWRSGDITRTQNVSEYTLVLALCLVLFFCICNVSAGQTDVHSLVFFVPLNISCHGVRTTKIIHSLIFPSQLFMFEVTDNPYNGHWFYRCQHEDYYVRSGAKDKAKGVEEAKSTM